MADSTTELTFVGVDPGVHGAIAVLRGGITVDQNDFEFVQVHPPGFACDLGEYHKGNCYHRSHLCRVVDAPSSVQGIVELCRQFALVGSPLISAIENPTPVPKQGVLSVATLYKAIGWWEATLAGYGRIVRVRPQDWKRSIAFENAATGDRLSKAWARTTAARLYPDIDLGKRSDEGRAEAVLIAHYLMKNYERLKA